MNPSLIAFLFVGVATTLLVYEIYFKKKGEIVKLEIPVSIRVPLKRPIKQEKPKTFSITKGALKSEKSPISGRCQVCGKKVTLPFRCSYCGGLFCEEHRLPENHNCPGF